MGIMAMLMKAPSASAAPPTKLNDDDAAITYSATGWSPHTDAAAYLGDYHLSTGAGATATFTLALTEFSLIGLVFASGGTASVTVDGSPAGTASCNGAFGFQQTTFSMTGLAPGSHTVVVTSDNSNFSIDAITYR